MRRPYGGVLAAVATAVASIVCATLVANAQATPEAPAVNPDAVVDLRTSAGAGLVDGHWRYSDARIVATNFRGKATYDITPRANAPDFDDSRWPTLVPETLEARRGGGKFSANWYRLSFLIPARLGAIDPTGDDVVFEIVVDDYSEIWANGALPLVLGQSGGGLVRGYNAPNRVVVARGVHPGQRVSVAVFGLNGPVSAPPENYIWIRSATLDFYTPGRLDRVALATGGRIERTASALDGIVAREPAIEKVATGFEFTEGPVWSREGNYLLFSDPNANNIYRWTPDGIVSVYRTKSEYAGLDIGQYLQPGSNGLTGDRVSARAMETR